MATDFQQLNDLKPGAMRSLGRGLYAVVARRDGHRTRLYAFRFTSPEGERALMEFNDITVRQFNQDNEERARERVSECKIMLRRDEDPRAPKRLAKIASRTLGEFIEEHKETWSAGMSKEETPAWNRLLKALPTLCSMPLHKIATEDVLKELKPIWMVKANKGHRLRQRLVKVFDAAKALKFRAGDNPAEWRANLKALLPSHRKLQPKKPHKSAPYKDIPTIVRKLRDDLSTSALVVEFGILTCTRSQEVRLAQWNHFNFETSTWRIPGEIMKIKMDEDGNWLDHLIPLSYQAIAILRSLPRRGRYVFPSDQNEDHQPYLPNALTGAIRRTGFKVTMHGMRTSFRNWGADNEEHNFRREVLEFCLSHRVGDEAELSYWTSEMLERRRKVMNAWADFVKPPSLIPEKRPILRVIGSAALDQR
jgi:integrase